MIRSFQLSRLPDPAHESAPLDPPQVHGCRTSTCRWAPVPGWSGDSAFRPCHPSGGFTRAAT